MSQITNSSHITRFMWPTWGPPGSCCPRRAPCWPHESCYMGWTICTQDCSGWITNASLLSLCEDKPPLAGRFPSDKVSNAQIMSISWRYHTNTTSSLFVLTWLGHFCSCHVCCNHGVCSRSSRTDRWRFWNCEWSHWPEPSARCVRPAIASQITSVSTVYSTVCSGADQRKHQSLAPLAFVRGIHRWPADSPHKGPVTRKMFPFDDVIIKTRLCLETANIGINFLEHSPVRRIVSSRFLNWYMYVLWTSHRNFCNQFISATGYH